MGRLSRIVLTALCLAVFAVAMPAEAADPNQVLLWAGSADGSITTLTVLDLTSNGIVDQWTYTGAAPQAYFPDTSPSSVTPSSSKAQVTCYDSGTFVTFTVFQPNGDVQNHVHQGRCPASGRPA